MNSDIANLGADVESFPPIPRKSLRERIVTRLAKVKFAETLAILLTVAALASGIATYLSMSGWGSKGPNATTTLILLNIDLLIVVGLTILVATRLIWLWRAHRAGTMGSRLHIRLVLLFGVIAMTPTVLIAVFSTLFFSFGFLAWFGDRV